MSSITIYEGAVKGNGALPFGITEKASSDFTHYARMLGNEWEVRTNHGPATVRLVRLNNASGVTAPGEKLFVKSTDRNDDYDVEVAAASASEAVFGIAPPNLADLVDNDYFFLVVDGVTSVLNDDGVATVVGDTVAPSASVAGSADGQGDANIAAGMRSEFGFAMEAVSTSTAFLVRLFKKLTG